MAKLLLAVLGGYRISIAVKYYISPQGPPAGFEYLSLETILNNEYEYSFNNLSFTN